MKTIEERAKEYAHKVVPEDIPFWDGVRETTEGDYINAATEQKSIDIDKACEWMESHLPRAMYDIKGEFVTIRDWKIDEFRKAMEE